jgi:capsular exopolysaccharide synthesis family protein
MNSPRHPEDIDLNKYWHILKRRSTPASIVFLSTVVIATLIALISEKKYEAYGQIRLTKENTTSALVTKAGEKLGKLETFTSTNTPVDTETEVIRSAPIINQVIAELNLKNKKGETITNEDFLENLKVKNIPGTDIVRVAYRSSDVDEAKSVVDRLIDTYLDSNISLNRTQVAAAREFLNQQLPKTEKALQEAEAQLRHFKEENNILNLNAETTLAVNQIGALDQQINSIKAQLEKVNGRINELENKLGIDSEEALALNTINDSPIIQQVLSKLKQVEDRLAIERSRFRDNNPIIASLEAEKAELETELQKRISQSVGGKFSISRQIFQTGDIEENLADKLVTYEVERRSLIKQLNSLQQAKANQKQRANLLPSLQQQYQNLARQVQVHQTTYNSLLNNLQQVEIAENQNVGNAQIVNRAVALEDSVSLSKKSTVAAGIGIGAILSLITAFLLELNDSSLKTTKELRNLLDYKVLGIIPSSSKKQLLPGWTAEAIVQAERQVLEAPDSLISQVYRILIANLQFLSSSENLKAITIASSVPQEGKSTVSANLATALARMGKKVMLIDADFHGGKQHLIWQLSNDVGLSDILLHPAKLTSAIKNVLPQLDVIPSGIIPLEPLSLLHSEQMNRLVDYCKNNYDIVIFDTPPILLFADALSISKLTDGVVLIGRPGVTNEASANASRELLEQSGQRVLGLVINGVENDSGNYYHYATSYYQDQRNNRSVKLLGGTQTK